jgi:hypothetical protein
MFTAALILARPAAWAASTIQFNRDIRPILAENCLACHGPDNGSRKAGLRLDTKDGMFERTPKHEPAVVPGSLEKSELWRRITTTDPDDVMPPPKSHKVLKPEQRELFKQWIVAGTPWQGHWAYIKPERPPLPEIGKIVISESLISGSKRLAAHTDSLITTHWVRNPIDAFVLARLQSTGLTPNSEADRRTLARRLALDLTGLPPKPEVVEGFVRDGSPDAYERLMNRFMNSPQWGEHRARYWLDAARYADTHGLHFDNYREMWPYREWVIKAFNTNMRFDQFTIEQLAGDLLVNPTDEQEVATGFQRCNMTTNEGGTIEDENLANYANDRVTTTSWVFLGSTLNCCACHDHKFDPFTTRDFYSMAAFYRNTTQGGFDKNIRESDLYKVMPQTDSDRARWKALLDEVEAAKQARKTASREADTAFTNWLASVKPENLSKDIKIPGEYFRAALNEGWGTNVASQLNGTFANLTGPTRLDWTTNSGPLGPAPVLTKDQSFVVGDAADFEASESFSFGAWVLVPQDFKGEGSVLARMGGEEEKYRGWDLVVRDDEFAVKMVNRWQNIAMEIRSTDKAVKRGEWEHLFVTYDGSGRTQGLKLFVNGGEVKANRDSNRLEDTIRSPFPLRIGRRERNNQLDHVAVQDVRIYRGRLSSAEVRAIAAAPRLAELLAQTSAEPTNMVPSDALRDYFLVTRHEGWQQAQARLAALEAEQALIRGRSPVTLVQVEKRNSEPMANILFRGQYDKPKDKVGPATPALLPAMPSDAPKNRLGLAQWIVSPENPLTARVTVNRFWQEIFGIGLVKNAEDFGTTSEPPSNPDLLDWLAVEFIESGWNVKHLFELIVTSSTYRQSAKVTSEKLEKDPQNRLSSRGPRFRMDAEMVRDYALAASGLLVDKIGGRSVKPYQPEGVWEAVAMPESNTRFYIRDHGEALYRRSLYTFWKRAAPPATMDIFNAPSREVCTVRRERTNTPLQALATLNDPQFLEAARRLAEVALIQVRARDDDAIEEMALRLLSRPLTPSEKSVVRETLGAMRAYYDDQPEAAKQLLATGESKLPDTFSASQLAAMTMVANQLMNLDEVLNK